MTDPITVIFDRESLDDSPLVMGAPSSSSSFWLPEDGIRWPRFTRRKTRAEASPYLNGPGALLARVQGEGTFALTFYVGGDTDVEVTLAMIEAQEAVDQWMYDLTLEVGGGSYLFTAECADDEIDWGEIDSGMVRARIARGSVAIPLLNQQVTPIYEES